MEIADMESILAASSNIPKLVIEEMNTKGQSMIDDPRMACRPLIF